MILQGDAAAADDGEIDRPHFDENPGGVWANQTATQSRSHRPVRPRNTSFSVQDVRISLHSVAASN
jgi:hypothetical protein